MKNNMETRKQRAAERQAERDTRTPHEQLRILEARGHGHCKEAKNLRKELGSVRL